MTRRDAVRVLGGGAALVGMGAIPGLLASGSGADLAQGLLQPFELPRLAYPYNALEPHIDSLTMELHHSKHHAAYIRNANKALEGQPSLGNLSAGEILQSLRSVAEPLRTVLRNNVGGHANHSFFWTILSPSGGGQPTGALASAIARDFGSLAGLKARVDDAAMRRFGSGWAWLTFGSGRLAVGSTANQDSPLSEGVTPILGIDVWEHAYYLKHQNRRADYLDAFWSVVDWDQAGRYYDRASGQA